MCHPPMPHFFEPVSEPDPIDDIKQLFRYLPQSVLGYRGV